MFGRVSREMRIMATSVVAAPDAGLIREVKKAGGGDLKKCYQCATCSVVCSLSPNDRPFPRKEMILAQWGRADGLMADPDIFLCHQCNDCSTHCPRGARPGDVLAAARNYLYQYYSFPRFMGRALASPKALPALLLVPVVVIIALIFLTADRLPDGTFVFANSSVVDFNLFMPHSSVDALFVLGNIIIFFFASVGFKRFWDALQRNGDTRQVSFLAGLGIAAREVISHQRFFSCETNRSRSWGHIMLFSGFAGAMVTTGLVFIFIFVPHYLEKLGLEQLKPFFDLPLDLPHPVKIVGAVSGVLILVGSSLLIFRRLKDSERVGASGYSDNLFLYMMFLTGLTGMTSWLLRWGGVAVPAYTSYFLHLVFVYFLLWYMPYSKFSHMIYRTLAIVHARRIGRIPRA
jgi:quinone-modifying oxidoreductase subunit QmoC